MTSEGAARAARLLLELGKSGSAGSTLQDVATALGEHKPTLLRTITSLTDQGFVEQVARGRYRLGPSIYALARVESAVAKDAVTWRPVLERLAERFGQTMHLVRRAGSDVVVVDMQVGSAPVQVLTSGIGGRLPMGIGSGSLAILSTFTPEEQRAIIAGNASRYERFGVHEADVTEIVRRSVVAGYASDVGLIIPECGGIGVPINEGGRYIATMSITLTAPLLFFSQNDVADVAHVMRRQISQHLQRGS